ncbi:MAG TPA: hypothetical protein ENF41_04350 [Candidatus Bathyarchaeota archaeon]|nr:hypothetical protein [Candidatus Bathyarchaeota archaeon]
MRLPFFRKKKEKEIVVKNEYPSSSRERVLEALTLLKLQESKLENKYRQLIQRSKDLFQACVEALKDGDKPRATVYANEVVQLKRVSQVILQSQLALKRTILRLEIAQEFRDVVNVLGPTVNIIRSLEGSLKGVLPEVAYDLQKVNDMLDQLVIEAGAVSPVSLDTSTSSREAEKILKEAAELAAQKTKEMLPELPEELKGLESR